MQSRGYKFAIFTCVLGTSLPAFLDSAWETATIAIPTETFMWSEKKTGFVISGVLATILVANSLAGYLSYKFEDRKIILVTVVLLIASSFFFVAGGTAAYFGAALVYMPAVSIVSASFSSVTTKICAKSQLMFLQTANGIGLQLALFLAAIYGTSGLLLVGRINFFISLTALCISIAICTCIAFRELKPPRQQMEELSDKSLELAETMA